MTTKIPVLCPICFNVGFVESIEKLSEILNQIWTLSLQTYPDGMKDVLKMYAGEAMIRHSPERLKEVYEQEGYITGICQSCNVSLSEKMYEETGLDIVRIGNMLFDKKFFQEHQEEIRKKLAK